jgi:uncharacterized glyoxalase superfamily protein PhnB
MIENRSVPSATVIPVLRYDDVAQASEWLCAVFGFKERLRIGSHRAQLVFGDGAVIVTERGGSRGSEAPAPGDSYEIHVKVADVDQHYEQARERGARILQSPESYPFGERQYSAVDLGGHQWTFSQPIADVAPEEWGGMLR